MTNNRNPNGSSSKTKRASKPFTVEVKRSRRNNHPFTDPTPPLATETSVAALTAVEIVSAEPLPQGRILPALEQQKPALEPTSILEMDEVDLGQAPQGVNADAEPELVAEENDIASPAQQYSPVVRPAIIAGSEARRPKTGEKLPREAFRRGERWKSRLPKVVHRSMRRRTD